MQKDLFPKDQELMRLKKSTFSKKQGGAVKFPHKTLEEVYLGDYIENKDDDLLFDETPTFNYLDLINPSEKFVTSSKLIQRSILDGHEISDEHRARMIDWMI